MHRTAIKDNIGYSVLTIYSKPFDCGGRCRFCFTDVKMPKSALNHEDTNRGLNCRWSAACQLRENFNRFSLKHDTTNNKYGVNIMGGSFTNYPKAYLESFVKEIYDFFNDTESSDLNEAKKKHTLSDTNKIVMICVQTLPNLITQEHCDFLKYLGITEVQIGVESINEGVLFANRRPHTKGDVINATYLLKQNGFAVTYHIMLGLIGSKPSDEINETIELLTDNQYSPDYVKIYPCIAVKGAKHNTPVNKWFEIGWEPLSDQQTLYALKAIMNHCPVYVGINRIQRLVDEDQILFGPRTPIDITDFKDDTNCIWLRSPMHNKITGFDINNVVVKTVSQGSGFYLEINFNDKYCIGYCRVELKNSCKSFLIRDMRVLGKMLPVGYENPGQPFFQHIGLGKLLISEIARLATSMGIVAMTVKSTPGLFRYFQKLNFIPRDNDEFVLDLNLTNKPVF